MEVIIGQRGTAFPWFWSINSERGEIAILTPRSDYSSDIVRGECFDVTDRRYNTALADGFNYSYGVSYTGTRPNNITICYWIRLQ